MAHSGDRAGEVYLAGKAVEWNDGDRGGCDACTKGGRRQERQGHVVAGCWCALAFADKGIGQPSLGGALAHIAAAHGRWAASCTLLATNASLRDGVKGTRLSKSLKCLALCQLSLQEKRFGKPAFAADLEGTEILVPIAFGHFGLRLNPKAKLIEVGESDGPVAHAVEEVLTDVWGQIGPARNPGHQSPNTMRPSASPRRLASSGSLALRKRSANSKNSCCLRFSASMPFSISSTSMRLELSLRVLARLRTCAAVFAGS